MNYLNISKLGIAPHPGVYTETFKGLVVISLDLAQHQRTCGYWYLVQTAGSAHTAFAEREHLIAWLELRGLTMTTDLPAEGKWGIVNVDGTYRKTSHTSYDAFYSIDGNQTRVLSNGAYTLGLVSEDVDGIVNVHSLNPNLGGRQIFDYAESRALFG